MTDLENAHRQVDRATDALVRAARSGDPDEIERTIAARGREVERLGRQLGDADARTRGRILQEIALPAAEALRALSELARQGRDEVDRLNDGRRSIRGYRGPAGAPRSLDRSG